MRERRPTAHGFDIELGWQDDDLPQPGNVPGGPRVILSAPLAAYLHATMHHPKNRTLPICTKVSRELARRAGVPDFHVLRMQWWAERQHDLCTLSSAEFRAMHGMSKSQVDGVRKKTQGRRKQKPGWYRDPDIARTILDSTQKEAATMLGVSTQAISMARVRLRREARQNAHHSQTVGSI